MRRQLFRYSVQLFAGLLLAAQLMPLTTSGSALSKVRPGKIKGQVFDVNKARVFSALVIVEGTETHRRLVTDENGEFEITAPWLLSDFGRCKWFSPIHVCRN